MSEFSYFPDQASSYAPRVDALFYYLTGITVFFTSLIALCILVFIIRYRRRNKNEWPMQVPTKMWLEITWSVIPFVIVLSIFGWGAKLYYVQFAAPPDCMDISVLGKQWMWKLEHPQGQREINSLHVPRGKNVRLLMTSQDVIHSFYVPAFRIKQDVLPERYTSIWFNATRVGTYHLFCAEYCGTGHAEMIGSVTVMEPADYEAWLAGTVRDLSTAAAGEVLFRRYGCNTCHGSKAPTLAGLYGRQVRLSSGAAVVADENYLRESILYPTSRIVAGFAPAMPSFKGQLSEEQLAQLIAYIKSLRDPEKIEQGMRGD